LCFHDLQPTRRHIGKQLREDSRPVQDVTPSE
jgi:hypothetical protein